MSLIARVNQRSAFRMDSRLSMFATWQWDQARRGISRVRLDAGSSLPAEVPGDARRTSYGLARRGKAAGG